ncbi:hypothetical protein O181_091441 [Austropuccinia psidii MF-1]|uniref:Uncharacterized protein n=1 Tax=Austropuccinia psidii MF-1 TaxID=1389203 RepID=A0A9Q3IXF6_9BASI|nr:hypothetical protein [Austropuccinia psidii MF-1]
MNPFPDPPDENDHMISPQIYKDKPDFFNSTNIQTDVKNIILNKINNLEKQLTQRSLPSDLKRLLNRICEKVESLAEKQNEMGKMIKTMLNRLDCLKSHPANKKQELHISLNSIEKTNTTPLSFAEVVSAMNTPRQNKPTTMAQPPIPTEQNRFKKSA